LGKRIPTLSEARDRVKLLSDNLPVAVDPLAVSTIAKTPTTALCYRESQAWRMEEFARAACDMFERGDLVVAISNTRHAAEFCAGVWYLQSLMVAAIADPTKLKDVHEKILRLQVGFKNGPDDMPEAINVLTMLQKLDQIIPGFYNSYERLSEIAHPNWAGSAAIYSKRDKITLITHFGRGLRDTAYSQTLGLNCLIGALDLFSYAYNKISDLTPSFARACERTLAD
jgi:hypothetical protein